MKVVHAEAMGMCFGVRDALAATANVADPASVTIHGELVHNPEVLVQLQTRGFRMVSENARDQTTGTPHVLVTAHGISDRERRRLQAEGKQLIDTTCPLVARVHQAAQALAAEGCHVLVVGRPGHVEVRGIVEDLASFDVVEDPEAVKTYDVSKLGVVCQTTTPPRLAENIISRIRKLNPHAEIYVRNTICQPTRDRQAAVERLLSQVDAMVVVGGKNSNNTRQLVQLCRDRGVPAFHVETAADLRPAWFNDCSAVGLTAGTSTLDRTIQEVDDALAAIEPRRQLPARNGSARTSSDWCEYFRNNAESLLVLPWDRGCELTDEERAAVGRSLAIFQLGESGDGQHLFRVADRWAVHAGDPTYSEAIRLFVAEENRHARDLGRFLDAAGIPRLRGHASDGVFRRLRHLAGLELSIAVLLTAELIAQVYYAAVRRATRSALLRQICKQILKDEAAHVRFQCEQLARMRASQPRWKEAAMRLFQRMLFAATCVAVWISHRRALRAGGYSAAQFWRAAWHRMNLALERMGSRRTQEADPPFDPLPARPTVPRVGSRNAAGTNRPSSPGLPITDPPRRAVHPPAARPPELVDQFIGSSRSSGSSSLVLRSTPSTIVRCSAPSGVVATAGMTCRPSGKVSLSANVPSFSSGIGSPSSVSVASGCVDPRTMSSV